MKLVKIVLLSLLVINLTACWPIGGQNGLFHNRENNYRQSQQQAALVIPAGLTGDNLQDTYPIPTGPAWSSTEPVDIAPPGSVLTKNQLIAPILKGNGPWLGIGSQGEPALLVKGDYATVWKNVASALGNLNYKSIGNDQRIGIYMVTRDNRAYEFNVLQAPQGIVITVQAYQSIPVQSLDAKKLLNQLAKQLA